MSSYLDWKVGDRVVCVDNTKFEKKLQLRCVYTISAVDHMFGRLWIGLVETPGKYHVHWESRRFRKVHPRKTDISIFEAILHGARVPEDA